MIKNEGYSVKREIMKGFMQLMTEKSYMDITVTDIVNKAGIARASFYRNFNSIYDVIETLADEVVDDLEEDVFPVLEGNDERKYRELLFNYFYRFKRQQKNIEPLRFENLSVIFTELDKKTEQKASTLSAETIRDKYCIAAKIGLINHIAKKWMDTGAKETPEEIIDYIMSFITKF